MRRLCWFALLLAASCEPSIGGGAYYCGPEQLCPPELACDPGSFTCLRPAVVQPFACPASSDDDEPDDDLASAASLGQLACGAVKLDSAPGCIDQGDQADYVELTVGECAGDDPHLELRLRYPVALVPLELALLDDSGAEVATAELCTMFNGMDQVCLDLLPPPGTYYLRIRPADSGDCDGACRFNQYLLDVRFLLA